MRLTAGIAALAFATCHTMATAGAEPRLDQGKSVDLIIRNVTVIDPERSSKRAGRDVMVRGGRIIAVVRSGSKKLRASHEIDGRGGYLMPGLMDMHGHSNLRMIHQSTLKLMTANGITGFRDMAGDCVEPGGIAMCLDEMKASQKAIDAGELVGPRIVELATAKIDYNRPKDASNGQKLYRPTNADQARETVAGLASRGPDILKISDQFDPDAFRALADAARARGLKLGGHIPVMFSVADVAAMGMTSIEHARDLPVDCSTYGAIYRRQFMATFKGDKAGWPDRKATAGKASASFDPAICKAQIAAMVANRTYYVPTHLTREMDYRAGEKAYRDDPRLQYIAVQQQRMWNRDLDRFAEAPPEMIADFADFFRLGLRTTKMAHDAGVKIMAGTDANDTMVFPGFSLHDELKHLVAAGLSPMAALQAATSVPAEYLGRTMDFGGVSEGKLADLLLLDADPTVDIANSARIAAVIQGGQVRDRAALDGLLAEVRQSVAMATAPAKGGQ